MTGLDVPSINIDHDIRRIQAHSLATVQPKDDKSMKFMVKNAREVIYIYITIPDGSIMHSARRVEYVLVMQHGRNIFYSTSSCLIDS